MCFTGAAITTWPSSPEYMIECELPLSTGFNLKPEDLVRVKIQHVNARKDVLSVFMG